MSSGIHRSSDEEGVPRTETKRHHDDVLNSENSTEIPSKNDRSLRESCESAKLVKTGVARRPDESNLIEGVVDSGTNSLPADPKLTDVPEDAIDEVLDDSNDTMPISSGAIKNTNKSGRKVVAIKSKPAKHRPRIAKAALQKCRAPDGSMTAVTSATTSNVKKSSKVKKKDSANVSGDEAKKDESGEKTTDNSSPTVGSEDSTLEMKSEEDKDGEGQTAGPLVGQLANISPAQRVLILSRRGDWYAVDQVLKHTEKLDHSLVDEVSENISLCTFIVSYILCISYVAYNIK